MHANTRGKCLKCFVPYFRPFEGKNVRKIISFLEHKISVHILYSREQHKVQNKEGRYLRVGGKQKGGEMG